MEISFKSNSGADKLLRITLAEDAGETKHFVADEDVIESGSDDDETDQMSFVAFKIQKTTNNGLNVYRNKYKPDESSGEKKYVVVEFRSDVDCRQFVESPGPPDFVQLFEKSKLKLSEVGPYTESLVADSRQERRRSRRSPRSSQREGSLSRMGEDDILLVYPFPADTAKLEKATEGLKELRGDSLSVAEPESSDATGTAKHGEHSSEENGNSSEENIVEILSRAHYLTVRVRDFDRLESGEFLNDTLIDFFLQWYVTRRRTMASHSRPYPL